MFWSSTSKPAPRARQFQSNASHTWKRQTLLFHYYYVFVDPSRNTRQHEQNIVNKKKVWKRTYSAFFRLLNFTKLQQNYKKIN